MEQQIIRVSHEYLKKEKTLGSTTDWQLKTFQIVISSISRINLEPIARAELIRAPLPGLCRGGSPGHEPRSDHLICIITLHLVLYQLSLLSPHRL